MRHEAKSVASQASIAWNAFGWATHALFGVTVYYLFLFLKGVDAPSAAEERWAFVVDVALALQFSVVHSVLLLPSVRKRLTRHIPQPAYGLFFCVCTCVTLLIAILGWRPYGGAIWQLSGGPRIAMQAAFYGAWVALFYSLALTGLGYQTGWTTWRLWARGKKVPPREFRPRGAYCVMRHPVYLSFLCLVWFTPCMTYDRAVLTAAWTAYIFYGSHLKDQRLLHYLGDRYRIYQAHVPGYPGLPFGPLARVPWNEPSEAAGAAS